MHWGQATHAIVQWSSSEPAVNQGSPAFVDIDIARVWRTLLGGLWISTTMATLLRKIGLIRLHDRDTEDPKHHQGSLKGTKGNQKNNTKHCNTSNETNILSTPEIKAKKFDHPVKDKPPGKDKQQGKDTKEKQQSSKSSSSIPSLAPHRQHCTQVRTRRLMKELQEIRRLCDNFITVELMDDNLFEWNVKLHQVDKDSALWQDMKETNTEFILLNVTFPDNFPFSPPFMRVLTPRLENGYVLDGGAICMELLTPRGWSSAYTVEAVMRQFAASLVKGQVRYYQATCVKYWLFWCMESRFWKCTKICRGLLVTLFIVNQKLKSPFLTNKWLKGRGLHINQMSVLLSIIDPRRANNVINPSKTLWVLCSINWISLAMCTPVKSCI